MYGPLAGRHRPLGVYIDHFGNHWFRRYQLPQVISTPCFFPRGRHLISADAKFALRSLILPRASKPNGHSRYLFHAVQCYDIVAVDFLHQENPPTKAGAEPSTLGTEGQRPTNYANLPAQNILYQG
ncbi:hypothetical protein TNCV_2651061 [Trichonephila clavipes]|nr:hypothetical protein TNCV_2651061 [Trichonephila clavipes]